MFKTNKISQSLLTLCALTVLFNASAGFPTASFKKCGETISQCSADAAQWCKDTTSSMKTHLSNSGDVAKSALETAKKSCNDLAAYIQQNPFAGAEVLASAYAGYQIAKAFLPKYQQRNNKTDCIEDVATIKWAKRAGALAGAAASIVAQYNGFGITQYNPYVAAALGGAVALHALHTVFPVFSK